MYEPESVVAGVKSADPVANCDDVHDQHEVEPAPHKQEDLLIVQIHSQHTLHRLLLHDSCYS